MSIIDDPVATPSLKPKSRSRSAVQALAMRLHFYAGVFVAPFVLIAALTGALYAISPTLESIANRDLLHVDSTGPARPLSEQIAAATAIRPDLALAAVAPAQDPGDTTRVIFTDPTLGESERRAVFIDPADARPVGDAVVYGSAGALPMRTWIDVLHKDLHLGQPGRLYSELAASWLWIIALAGLALWWRRVRSRRERGSAGWLLRPDRSRDGRARTMNWHGAVGMWVLLPVLFLSATGMTWSTYAGEHVDALRAQLSWTTPVVSSALPGSAAPAPADGEHAEHGGGHRMGAPVPADRAAEVDKVLAVARGHGVEGPLEISVPAKDGVAFVAKERRLPGVLTQDAIAIDGATGDVVDTLRYRDWPLMAKLTNWGIALHMGILFGLANQVLLLITMIALITVIARGYLMWWKRRPTRSGSALALGRAPRRGALRRTPIRILAPLAAGAVLIGWFAPLVGWSLLGFLLVDVIVGSVRRRREAAAA
ncbi:putative iron-regulated membrane protein [Nocardia pseudobrasiliensis]|uniref:Putative iron-regulated membrane protein n=2 Tax=Nocardia pseudobrasiliensis TaxID=45979 RepID=A0A370IDZ8_9NOCA|nr:PepSY domain-containing protein [Nocardia pseudobrasiliensis]RDI68933.1 putative iron-regulated membrane protein [Nocardia pseudobrasiliensis]